MHKGILNYNNRFLKILNLKITWKGPLLDDLKGSSAVPLNLMICRKYGIRTLLPF